MYGKKRITITNDKVIVLAGNKSWIPVGKYSIDSGLVTGRLRNPDSWDRTLDETNSIKFELKSVAELRSFANTQYNL
jgi:hypothetical protein